MRWAALPHLRTGPEVTNAKRAAPRGAALFFRLLERSRCLMERRVRTPDWRPHACPAQLARVRGISIARSFRTCIIVVPGGRRKLELGVDERVDQPQPDATAGCARNRERVVDVQVAADDEDVADDFDVDLESAARSVCSAPEARSYR